MFLLTSDKAVVQCCHYDEDDIKNSEKKKQKVEAAFELFQNQNDDRENVAHKTNYRYKKLEQYAVIVEYIFNAIQTMTYPSMISVHLEGSTMIESESKYLTWLK